MIFCLTLTFPLAVRGNGDKSEENVLNVYCYDSFSSEWGPGPVIAESFYEVYGIRLKFNAPGDAVTVLNQLILEKGKSNADIVVGLDNSLLIRALSAGILEPYESHALDSVPSELVFDETYHLLPFDYGYFAVCYDSEAMPVPPASLEDLISDKYTDSLILMDPRTSTPGLGFLLWTIAVYGDGWPEYWQRLRPSILTITESWSQGYTLFTAGEAPMVLSYGTSPVYHTEYEGTYRYRAADFSDGHIMQIEGMGIVSGTDNRNEAELFIDFMLSDEAQIALAKYNIMLPVNSEVTLPQSFETSLRPGKKVSLSGGFPDADEIEGLIRQWTEVFRR